MSPENDYLETAHSIGAEICRDALWYSDQCNWLGDIVNRRTTGSGKLATTTLDSSLYGGTSGIALFLAHLSRRTNESWFRKCALGAARHAYERLAAAGTDTPTGYYNGLTGVACALVEIGNALGEDAVTDQGISLLSRLDLQKTWKSTDIISGAAGVILGLASIRERFAAPVSDDLFEQLGRRLLQSAAFSELGCSWKTLTQPTSQHLTGYAHGVAGIITSLARLKAMFGGRDYDATIDGGLAYERHWHDEATDNWPDFRKLSQGADIRQDTRSTFLAWCHGAPGILLSRIAMHHWNDLQANDNILTRALSATLADIGNKRESGGNFSICHGLGGNAEILQLAAKLPRQSKLLEDVTSIATFGQSSYGGRLPTWPSGVIGGGHTPKLMLGLAGTGMFYLRLQDGKNLPSLICPGLPN